MDTETEADDGSTVDENVTANYTIKDVTLRDRRRMRRYSRRHGLAAREALTAGLDALEAIDNRTEIIGPTIERNRANSGLPMLSAAYSPLEMLQRLVALEPRLLDDKVLQRRLKARARQVSRQIQVGP